MSKKHDITVHLKDGVIAALSDNKLHKYFSSFAKFKVICEYDHAEGRYVFHIKCKSPDHPDLVYSTYVTAHDLAVGSSASLIYEHVASTALESMLEEMNKVVGEHFYPPSLSKPDEMADTVFAMIFECAEYKFFPDDTKFTVFCDYLPASKMYEFSMHAIGSFQPVVTVKVKVTVEDAEVLSPVKFYKAVTTECLIALWDKVKKPVSSGKFIKASNKMIYEAAKKFGDKLKKGLANSPFIVKFPPGTNIDLEHSYSIEKDIHIFKIIAKKGKFGNHNSVDYVISNKWLMSSSPVEIDEKIYITVDGLLQTILQYVVHGGDLFMKKPKKPLAFDVDSVQSKEHYDTKEGAVGLKFEVYQFGAGARTKLVLGPAILGGKGVGLVQMDKLDLPVPPGFIFPTSLTAEYESDPTGTMAAIAYTIPDQLARLEKHFGYMPLLSVRSGAPVSMPGMMDTILNVGLSRHTFSFWAEKIGKKAALDSYRRLIDMYGCVVEHLDHSLFEDILTIARIEAGVDKDSELDVDQIEDLVDSYLTEYAIEAKSPFPSDVAVQLQLSIAAVFNSWHNPRAKTYRMLNGISDDIGTAVIIQAMVFGNMNDNSGSGVLFTRNPATGENKIVGEFLPNAQGEDVVAGGRTPLPLDDIWPDTAAELVTVSNTVEKFYRDMQDLEFTVQDGELFILQTRSGKRTAHAAFRIAVEMVEAKVITKECALTRITGDQYVTMQSPVIDPKFDQEPIMVGLPACNGVVSGRAVFSAEEAVDCPFPCILVTAETNPDDIAGMKAAIGILTATGGFTSHAAVVARAMDTPCVTGCSDMKVMADSAVISEIGENTSFEFGRHTIISIDGGTGRVWSGPVPTINGAESEYVKTVIGWVFEDGRLRKVIDLNGASEAMVMATEWVTGRGKVTDHCEKFLDDMKKVKDRSKIVFNLTAPSHFRQGQDESLWSAFGTSGAFETEGQDYLLIFEMLASKKEQLAGMVLEGVKEGSYSEDDLRDMGYKITKNASKVGDLLDGDAVTVSDDFIKNIVGGKGAYKKLLSALVAGGVPVVFARQGYYEADAVYAALGSS